MNHTIQYAMADDNGLFSTETKAMTVPDLETAQLVWDSLLYLRNRYRLVSTRPALMTDREEAINEKVASNSGVQSLMADHEKLQARQTANRFTFLQSSIAANRGKTVVLRPAHGRRYETLAEVKASWEKFEDFQIDGGPYVNIREVALLKSAGYESISLIYGAGRYEVDL